jgi:quercetin dioxygenase-like cupin family protein
MENWIIKRFQQPDETRTFEKGKFEIIHIGDMTIGKAEYQPGWKWSEHVSPIVGTPMCHTDHVGLVLSGRAIVKMEDGSEVTLTPGDIFAIAPGHDSWVVGNEIYISLHFLGAGEYGTKNQKQ